MRMNSSSSAPSPEIASYVPSFGEDIFLSYGHIDNAYEWVTALHERLRLRIPEIVGKPVRIWRDKKLGGADALWDVIEQRINASAVFISILSPRYVTSDACAREVACFHAAAERTGGLTLNNMARMIRVIKTPHPDAPEPQQLAEIETLGFPFYKVDPQDERSFEEFQADRTLPGFTEFFTVSEQLAQGVARLLKQMHDQRVSTDQAKTAFVAYTSSDRKADRDTLINNLRSKGFGILPAEPLPESAADLNQVLEKGLKTSTVAIHVLGSKVGTTFDDDPRAVIRLQYDLVRNSEKPVRQILWIPEGLSEIDSRQQQFLDELKTVGDQKTEVLRTGRAAFIESVLDELERKPEAKRADQAKSVFLLYTREDLEQPGLKQIRNYLLSHGYPLEQPAFQGDPAMLQELRNQSISATDAALIYYGTAPDGWVEMMRMTLRKALATSEARNRYMRVVYLSVPDDALKKNKYLELPSPELPESGVARPLMVLGDCGPFDPAKLKPFLDQLTVSAS